MKISKLLGLVLISGSLLAFSAEKASAFSYGNEHHDARNEHDDRGRGDDNHRRGDEGRFGHNNHNGGRRGDESSSGTSLPINGQAWLLLVAGLGIGSFFILDKTKALR